MDGWISIPQFFTLLQFLERCGEKFNQVSRSRQQHDSYQMQRNRLLVVQEVAAEELRRCNPMCFRSFLLHICVINTRLRSSGRTRRSAPKAIFLAT